MKRLLGAVARLACTGCAALLFLAATSRDAHAAPPTNRPNFLIFLADDMGYSDLGCFGGEIETPHLDQLAKEGLRFTQFYNTARCWPTRGALLTGYYAQAIRRDQLPAGTGGTQGRRPTWARLLPELLKPAGYRSYHSGKWHVDGLRLAGGFDRSYSIEDHDRHFHPKSHLRDDVALPPAKPGSGYYSTTAIADHAIECLREHATLSPRQPFFQFVAFTAPHFPLQAPPEDIARYRTRYAAGWDAIRTRRVSQLRRLHLFHGTVEPPESGVFPPWNATPDALNEAMGPGEISRAIPWEDLSPTQQTFQAEKMAVHAAMIDRMDREIGRVLDQLRTMGAWENTVVLFLSDNGASAEQILRGDGHKPGASPGSAESFLGLGPGWSTVANTPFRKHKSWVHEGGIATAMIAHWPKGIPARDRGDLRPDPQHVVDLAPTLLDLAGLPWPTSVTDSNGVHHPVPAPHGQSFARSLQRRESPPPRTLWWLHEGNRAVRVGDWKLVSSITPSGPGKWELYDLRRDRAEHRDLASRHPGRVRDLEQTWNAITQECRTLAQPAGSEAAR